MTNKVLLIYTGGTSGRGCNPVTGALEPLDFNLLSANMQEFRLIKTEVDVHQFNPPIDSSDMSPERWAQLAELIHKKYECYDGFVILHGTDTMAYTASALSFMLQNLIKPVILTGSQLPIGQLRTDGKENLITSIELASAHNSEGHSMVPEVCIYFSGRLLRGNRSTKKTAEGFRAFDSYNFPHLCDAGVNFVYHEHNILTPDYSKPLVVYPKMDSGVIVFSLFPGIREDIIHNMLTIPNVRGIVMRSYGSGNAPQKPVLTKLLRQATDSGVTIVNVTQCDAGSVEMARYDSGFHLKEAGVVSGYDSTVEAAVTKLMHLQGIYDDPTIIRENLNRSLTGEITV